MLLVGCEEDDWGDQASKFVDEKAHGISEAHVKAQLSREWLDFFYAASAEYSVHAREILVGLRDLTAPDLSDVDEQSAAALLRLFNVLDGQRAQLDEARVQIAGLDARINATLTVCHDKSLFWGTPLPQLGINGPLSVFVPSLPEGEVRFDASWSGNLFADAYGAIESLFGASTAALQNRRLAGAINRLPQKLLSAAEVFELSQVICAEELGKLRDSLVGTRGLVSDIQAHVATRYQQAAIAQAIVSSYLRPLEIASFLRSAGVTDVMTEFQSAFAAGQLTHDLERALIEIRRRFEQVERTGGCLEKLEKAEEFEDAMIELASQIRAIRPQVSAPDIGKRMDDATKTLASRIAAMPKLYQKIRGDRCDQSL